MQKLRRAEKYGNLPRSKAQGLNGVDVMGGVALLSVPFVTLFLSPLLLVTLLPLYFWVLVLVKARDLLVSSVQDNELVKKR